MPRTRKETGARTADTPGDHSAELARLLPELAVTLYRSAPPGAHGQGAPAEPLTERQMEAVVFLAHRGRVSMGDFAAGLEISRAAASELVARLLDKGVVSRDADAADRRVVYVRLAGRAEGYAEGMIAQWREQLDAVFARFPEIDPDTLVAFLRDLVRELKGRPRP